MSRTTLTALLGFALIAPALALATGFGSDNPPSRIPIPAKDFSARVEDHGGTVVSVDRVTWNGEVFLYGTIGAAQVTVPFDRITRVAILPHAEAGKRTAKVTMTDGEIVEIAVNDDTPCYGRTRFGNYAIEAEDIRFVTFAPRS
jgi:hypothetical protein